jgi:hypothetical protein
LQLTPQLEPSHVATPFPPMGGGHARQEFGPHDDVEELLEQVPLQLCVPAGHVQLLFWQVLPPEHLMPHPPQFELSLWKL